MRLHGMICISCPEIINCSIKASLLFGGLSRLDLRTVYISIVQDHQMDKSLLQTWLLNDISANPK